MMLPSVTAAEPTKIKYGPRIAFKEAVIEEISSLFSYLSLRNLSVWISVSDLAVKEEQVLQWAETDSLQTSRVQIPIVDAGAVQDLDSRPPYSAALWRLWADVCVDVVQFNIFGHLLPVGMNNLCRDVVAAGPVIDIEEISMGFLNPEIQILSSCSSSDHVISPRSERSISSSSSSSSGPLVDFTDDIPQTPPTDDVPRIEETTVFIPQIDVPPVVLPSTYITEDFSQFFIPAAVVPTADYTESFAQILDSIDQIRLEHVRTRDDIDDLKATLYSRIKNLEAAVANETQTGIATLSAQLSEIIAYMNRGRDDKKGEESSRGPTDDRSRLVKEATEVNLLREVEDQTEVVDRMSGLVLTT
ncbi:hypothetical protein F511_31346 [Dorcoceras hygrometricum]|uniref:Uncharacterized protein n=1 Tax=Dorcoceras hygrometricum TaxID=472368 RepID=A0A2Z7B9Z7_9LAMI|nr:hypothetical protein F511_31346 [Dorcoceras hygrometricum]